MWWRLGNEAHVVPQRLFAGRCVKEREGGRGREGEGIRGTLCWSGMRHPDTGTHHRLFVLGCGRLRLGKFPVVYICG